MFSCCADCISSIFCFTEQETKLDIVFVSRLDDNSKVVKCICRKAPPAEHWSIGRDDDLGVNCSRMYRRVCRMRLL
jgi:hypothetical protein